MAKLLNPTSGEKLTTKVGLIEDIENDVEVEDIFSHDVIVTTIIYAENCEVSISQKQEVIDDECTATYEAKLNYAEDQNGNSIVITDNLDELLDRAYDSPYDCNKLAEKISDEQSTRRKKQAKYMA